MSVLKRLRRPCLAALSATLLLTGVSAPVAAVVDGEPSENSPADAAREDVFTAESESGLWIVRLDEAPLASYRGEVSGLAATSPEVTGDHQLNANSRDSVAYLDHLAAAQESAVAEIESALGRDVEVAHEYRAALNGMAIEMRATEAAVVSDLADVAGVTPDEAHELDTDVSNELISSPAIWNGETAKDIGSRGEGVIVGMIDTGVNPDHPSFAATDGDGYTHTNPLGSGTYVGVCDPEHPHHDPICNDKLIGAWDYTSSTPDARDEQGHGSHTGSTMAGNTHDAVVTAGDDEFIRTVSGVAPRANVISYKTCGMFGCFTTDNVAAVNQAILDGVDVLNYSISGGDTPWNNAVDLAFLEAYEAGIFVSASAGNTGPGEHTVAKTGPWNASVAATTHERVIANALDIIGPEPVPSELTGIAAVLGNGSPLPESVEAPIQFADPLGTANQACEPFEAGTFDGAIALIKRGGCAFAIKIDNATDAGAVGVVVFNQFGGPPVVMGELDGTTVPGLMVSNGEGTALHDHIAASEDPVTARLDVDTTLVFNDDWADVVTDFSARGPSQYDLLAPTFAAPGRNILAAGAADGDDPLQYETMQGTSMSSPQAAGAGALLKALHPDWSPAAIRSALATSAHREGLVKEDGTTTADPFDVGSGRLNLARASRVGAVFDETHENFVAADPEAGGDPKTLNLPALVNQTCDESCTWTRTLTSVADVPVNYTAAVDTPEEASVAVTPETFTLEPGSTQTVEVTMDISVDIGGEWMFGGIDLSTEATHGASGRAVSDVHLPIAVVQPEPVISVDPTELHSLQDVAQRVPQTVTLTNSGGAPLNWEVDTTTPDCALPSWASVAQDSGTASPDSTGQVEVVFDSTDMTAGDYTDTLCIASDDPHTPMVLVDLVLTVVEIPVVDVTDGAVAKTQPSGTITGGTFEIRNDGWGTLNWTLHDEDAGPSEERIQMLRDGVLLAPNSWFGNTSVMAFDPETGDLMDASFIADLAFDPDELIFTPKQVLPTLDNTGLLVVDQFQDTIVEYDLSGQFRRVYAPHGSAEDLMSNIRGIAWSPEDTLLVTSGFGANGDSVLEFDADGNFVGQYIPSATDGLDGPWGVLVRDDDILVAGQGSAAIHSFAFDGTANGRFAEEMPWTQQLADMDNGNVLAANYASGSSDVYEFDGGGTELGRYDVPGRSTGAHPLGNGNIIVSSDEGVFEISRDGTVQETKSDEPSVEYFTEVQMPDAQACSTPDEVPWLSVSAAEGAVASGSANEVAVSLDSTGLEAGDYTAQLCVTSDDPDMPLVTVPVQMTVTDGECTITVTDAHLGSLRTGSGLLCLGYGSSVSGPVRVTDGADIFADGATVNGPVSIVGAGTVRVHGTMVNGPVHVTGSSGPLTFDTNDVRGPVRIARNDTGEAPIVVAGNTVSGALSCSRNTPSPVNGDDPNEVSGPRSGQCADL